VTNLLHRRPGLTAVKIIDFNYVHYLNAEVEVLLPEESGIVQIEVPRRYLAAENELNFAIFPHNAKRYIILPSSWHQLERISFFKRCII
jgi:hypothetical protein